MWHLFPRQYRQCAGCCMWLGTELGPAGYASSHRPHSTSKQKMGTWKQNMGMDRFKQVKGSMGATFERVRESRDHE